MVCGQFSNISEWLFHWFGSHELPSKRSFREGASTPWKCFDFDFRGWWMWLIHAFRVGVPHALKNNDIITVRFRYVMQRRVEVFGGLVRGCNELLQLSWEGGDIYLPVSISPYCWWKKSSWYGQYYPIFGKVLDIYLICLPEFLPSKGWFSKIWRPPCTGDAWYCWWFRNPAPVEVGSLSHCFWGFHTSNYLPTGAG